LLKALITDLFADRGRKLAGLGAKLAGVSGYTGRGDVDYACWGSGAKRMNVALRGVAGTSADLYADDEFVATLAVNNGKLDQKCDTARGDLLPELHPGSHIEIRQNDHVILEGVLQPH